VWSDCCVTHRYINLSVNCGHYYGLRCHSLVNLRKLMNKSINCAMCSTSRSQLIYANSSDFFKFSIFCMADFSNFHGWVCLVESGSACSPQFWVFLPGKTKLTYLSVFLWDSPLITRTGNGKQVTGNGQQKRIPGDFSYSVTVCSLCQRKFVIFPFVDEETKGSCPFEKVVFSFLKNYMWLFSGAAESVYAPLNIPITS
jgi:hypothetical protein